MRLAIAAYAAALASAGPVPPAPLAPGETTVEILATGAATAPADLIIFTIGVNEAAPTDAEARRMVEEGVRRVTSAARSMGVAESDIRASAIHLTTYRGMTRLTREAYRYQAELRWSVRRQMRPGYDANRAYAYEPPPEFNAEASAGVVVRLRDLARMEAVRGALNAAYDGEVNWPEFALSDWRRIQREARLQALAIARAEAQAQADARNMRVARIARVTERVGAQLADRMLSDSLRRRPSDGQSWRNPEITTRLPIAVEFVLAPR